MKRILISTLSAFVLIACGGEQKTETKTGDTLAVEETKAQVCTYTYQHDSTRVEWIAYKCNEKTGVKGRFRYTEVNNTTSSTSMYDVLKGAAISIPIDSLETNDKGRNEKIVKFVFGKMNNTKTITGTLKGFAEDGSSATLVIKMNEIEKEINAPASWEGEKVTLKTDINLGDFNALSSVDAITNACKENHKGSDGIAKVWPDVTIIVSTTLKKECAE